MCYRLWPWFLILRQGQPKTAYPRAVTWLYIFISPSTSILPFVLLGSMPQKLSTTGRIRGNKNFWVTTSTRFWDLLSQGSEAWWISCCWSSEDFSPSWAYFYHLQWCPDPAVRALALKMVYNRQKNVVGLGGTERSPESARPQSTKERKSGAGSPEMHMDSNLTPTPLSCVLIPWTA